MILIDLIDVLQIAYCLLGVLTLPYLCRGVGK